MRTRLLGPARLGRRRTEGLPVLAIAAATGEGIPELRARLAELLPPADELAGAPEPAGIVVHRIDPRDAEAFEIDADPAGGYRVRGPRIERLAAQTNFDVEESAERFQRDLLRLGVDGALRRAGVRPGDTVRVGAVELEWEPAGWDEP